MINSTTGKVASHGLALPLFRIGIPAVSRFDDWVDRLVSQSFAQENRERPIREKTIVQRHKTCILFIEGLYQAFSCHVPDTALAFPHSQRFYKQGQFGCISEYSYRNVHACYQALILLGWITYCPGYLDQEDVGHPTTIAPHGELLAHFTSAKVMWQRLAFSGDPVILRHKIANQVQTLEPPFMPDVQVMRGHMQRINGFLADQAICLNLSNGKLKKIAIRMAGRRYSYDIGYGLKRTRARTLNFANVALRRIFARGRMDRGGRLYGGWWQTIPKDDRRYITINGRPTVEVDFSEIHPTMLYLLNGQSAPERIYDLGLMRDGDPLYNPEKEPHKTRRKIIKTFVNALINDERQTHKLSKSKAKQLGLSHDELKDLVLQKHPVIAQATGSDIGVYLQYLDSEIAVRVLVQLMELGITALPIHDSFCVQEEFVTELIAAMQQAFTAVMNADTRLKDLELPLDGFDSYWAKEKGRYIREHSQSVHHQIVKSWRQQHPEPSHMNTAQFAPYRFPDGSLLSPLVEPSPVHVPVQGYYVKQ